MYVYVYTNYIFLFLFKHALALDCSFSPETMNVLIPDKTFVQLYYIANVIMIFVSFFLETFLLFCSSVKLES